MKKGDTMFVRNHTGLHQLGRVAEELLAHFPDAEVFAFYGKMGAGKTTLIQEICKALHSDDRVTSPTFAIVNQYFTDSGTAIYHFDFYRLKNLEEAYDLGYEDYFYSGAYCLIEWPEKVEPLLPDNHVKVTLEEESQGWRVITAVNNFSGFENT
ncbi:MAG TPA: tRNA (adenosine(37)-N6)-threonylcarbamoyltransferase complex ATPase subunit type 1 TsaE [Prolixibacteraceae bacterium]|nr:tRNA (adenosine(37)-N6)-threonylcarbamoyltransferase complex ATPase subunit type 1 TsaE [Prolixibacteraceae bacterium]HPT31806.1 tRNA (adenosine(37)-N6)-threonylcarbamoyltransferase complex ATPase subunit type 1 TsaE [Prolixibacteraceae bacterium]